MSFAIRLSREVWSASPLAASSFALVLLVACSDANDGAAAGNAQDGGTSADGASPPKNDSGKTDAATTPEDGSVVPPDPDSGIDTPDSGPTPTQGCGGTAAKGRKVVTIDV